MSLRVRVGEMEVWGRGGRISLGLVGVMDVAGGFLA